MGKDTVLNRLGDISRELVELYGQRPVVVRAYFDARAASYTHNLENGWSATAAREQADRDCSVHKYEMDRLEADILVLVEERDHLRFTLDHLD